MKRYFGISLACLCSVLLVAGAVWAKPTGERFELSEPEFELDLVGDVDGTANLPVKAAQDTVWIADWTFDTGGSACDETGWTIADNRIQSDGIHHWEVNSDFAGSGFISGDAAVVGGHDLCWVIPDGYGNDWYTAIRIDYAGDSFLSFDYLVDSEGGFDFLQVETDSACVSFDLVDYDVDPQKNAAAFRGTPVFQASGLIDSGSVDSLSLSGFGTGDTHCVYIAFFADGAFSPEDGNQPTVIGEAAVVDNISMVGGTTYSEDFSDGTLDGAVFVNIQDVEPFAEVAGGWSRTFNHITDNDVCTENVTCAWLDTDYGPTTPTVANDPSLAFAPGSYVVKNWADDLSYSPWASLATTPGAAGTTLAMRRFPGNNFGTSLVVQNWSVRGKSRVDNTDTPAPGDSIDCVSPWGHVFQWNSLSFFGWTSPSWPMESDFPSNSTDVQLRFRRTDWRIVTGNPAPATFFPGPGPFWDRIRIGRQVLSGPAIDEGIDSRYQGQDAFATDQMVWPGSPAHQESFVPRTTRFGTVAFSTGTELGTNFTSPNLITGDSITVNVSDVRGAGGITSVEVWGCIVEGPHAGQAPPPHAVSGHFFAIAGDSSRSSGGVVITDRWFVDMDDDYFLPGDVLRYFWIASDLGGGWSSNPVGVTSDPTGMSLDDVQLATGGLFETNFLPAVNWDADIVTTAQTGNNGQITQATLDSPPANWEDEFGAVGEQKNCILYYQGVVTRRRSGDINRTTFMYTMDQLGYRGQYDTYDHQGFGNTNNHLGGRATVDQATGYALIIYDQGNRGPAGNILPDGSDLDTQKVLQGAWFQSYLNAGSSSEIGVAGLWFVSSNAVQEKQTDPLFTTEMGLSFVSGDQGLNSNPDVDGIDSMTYSNGNNVDYSSDLFAVQGGCPTIRDYDALAAVAGTETHSWKDPNSATLGDAAIVQNSNVGLSWNTIMQAFPLFDMRGETAGDEPDKDLVQNVLDNVVPAGCLTQTPTDVPGDEELENLPSAFSLQGAYPNPFNPMTTIKFDVPRNGHVDLKVYDVAGRMVRTLVNGEMEAKRGHQVTWDGLNHEGRRVASGIYFVNMRASDGFSATTKIVMTK